MNQSPQIKTAELADDAVQEQFREIINSLNLELGEDGFFRGMVGKVPMLMKLKSVDSSGYFFEAADDSDAEFKNKLVASNP